MLAVIFVVIWMLDETFYFDVSFNSRNFGQLSLSYPHQSLFSYSGYAEVRCCQDEFLADDAATADYSLGFLKKPVTHDPVAL